jgi:hypothetical protein
MTLASGNRISFAPTEEKKQAIHAAIRLLQETLKPLLVDLSVDERRALPKMGSKTVEFVGKALNYARESPQFNPSFVDVDEFARDLAAVQELLALQRPLSMLADMVEDSVMLSGSEAYAAALSYYRAVKAAALLGQPGATLIAEDLGLQFANRGPKPGGAAGAPSRPPAA